MCVCVCVCFSLVFFFIFKFFLAIYPFVCVCSECAFLWLTLLEASTTPKDSIAQPGGGLGAASCALVTDWHVPQAVHSSATALTVPSAGSLLAETSERFHVSTFWGLKTESGGATIFNRPGRLGRRRWNIWRDLLGRDEIKTETKESLVESLKVKKHIFFFAFLFCKRGTCVLHLWGGGTTTYLWWPRRWICSGFGDFALTSHCLKKKKNQKSKKSDH